MKTLKKKQQNAGMIVSKIATTVLASQSAKDFLNDSATFIVDMSPEIHKGLKDGVIKLVEENGNLYAQLKDSNNHYSKNSL